MTCIRTAPYNHIPPSAAPPRLVGAKGYIRMMRRFIGIALLAVLVLAPQQIQAQDLIGRDLAAQEDLKFIAGSGVGASFDNVQVGPYTGDITSGSPTLPGITLYCVDFANGITLNHTWTADVTGIGSGASDAAVGGTMGNTRLGNNTGSLNKYRQAAFLASLFSSYTTYMNNAAFTYSGSTQYTSKKAVYSGIHGAIWSIMTAGYPTGAVNDAALATAMSSTFIGLANTALAANFAGYSMDFDNWSVMTDVVNPGVQEYLVQTSVVPEPETYVLMFSGLILLWGVARKRLREEDGQVA